MSDLAELNIVITSSGVVEGNVALNNLTAAATTAETKMQALMVGADQMSAKFKLVNTDALTAKQSMADYSNSLEYASRLEVERVRALERLRASYRQTAEAAREMAVANQQALARTNAGGLTWDSYTGPPGAGGGRLGTSAGEVETVNASVTNLSRNIGQGLRPGIILATASLAEFGERGGRVIGTIALAISRLAIFGFSTVTAAIVGVVFALELWQDKSKDAAKIAAEANEKHRKSLDDVYEAIVRNRQAIRDTEFGGPENQSAQRQQIMDAQRKLDALQSTRSTRFYGPRGIDLAEEEKDVWSKINELRNAGFSDRDLGSYLRRLEQIRDVMKEHGIATESEIRLQKQLVQTATDSLAAENERKGTLQTAKDFLEDMVRLEDERARKAVLRLEAENFGAKPMSEEAALVAEQARLATAKQAARMLGGTEAAYNEESAKQALHALIREVETRERNVELLEKELEAAKALRDHTRIVAGQKSEAELAAQMRAIDRSTSDRITQAELDAMRAGDPDKRDKPIWDAQADVAKAKSNLDAAMGGPASTSEAELYRLTQEVIVSEKLLDLAREMVQARKDEDEAARDMSNRGKALMRDEQAYIDLLKEGSKIREQSRDRKFNELDSEAEKNAKIDVLKNNSYEDESRLLNLIAAKKKQLAFMSENEYRDQNETVAKLQDQLDKYESILKITQEIHAEELKTVSGRRADAQKNFNFEMNKENSGDPVDDFRSGFSAQTKMIHENLATTREFGSEVARTLSDDFSNIFDVFRDETKSASEKWKEFAVGILEDIAKIGEKWALNWAFSTLMGGGNKEQPSGNDTAGYIGAAASIAGAVAGAGKGGDGGGGGGGVEKRGYRDISIVNMNIRDQSEADFLGGMMGSNGATSIVSKGTGQPGVTAGTLKAGRR